MNCDNCKNELEDFLYGELCEARAAEMRAHLGICAVCAALRDEINHENEIFGRFYEQTAIDPAAEMWDAIRARINSEARDRTLIENGASNTAFGPQEFSWLERLRARASGLLLAPSTLRQVAFAALIIVLSVTATTIYLKLGEKKEANNLTSNGDKGAATPAPRQVAPPAPSRDVAGGVNSNSVAPAPKPPRPRANRAAPPRQLTDQELVNRQIARAEREYQKAIRLLDMAVAKQRDRLDPALIKQYESSMALIDDSINTSRRALRERPDDPTAGQFLLAAYAKKLDLMQEIAMK
jgi:hypothetical protein